MLGYGAQLALKRTDYLVIDDSNPTTPAPDAESVKVEPLKMNQISNIGLRAVSRISNADNPLDELEDISQNLPSRASKLLGSKVSKELKEELKNIRDIVVGDIFMINGRKIDATLDVILTTMREESALAAALHTEGLSTADVVNLLTFDLELPTQFDRFDVRSSAVIYLNDFEKDIMYERWPDALETFMRPLYPGQFHTIRRNAHTIIFSADLSSSDDRELIANFASFVTRGLPVRWGIVPVCETALQKELALAFEVVLRIAGVVPAIELLAAAAETSIATAYQKLLDTTELALPTLAELTKSDLDKNAKDWTERFGKGRFYSNGRPLLRDESLMQRLSAQLRDDTMLIQESMLEGGIIDTGDLQDFWMGSDPIKRYSDALFGERRYAPLEEVKQSPGVCRKQFEIVLSGQGWPEEEMATNDPCISHVAGPRRMTINGRIVNDLTAAEIPMLLQQEQKAFDKYAAAAERIEKKLTPKMLALLRSSTKLRTALPKMVSTNTHFELGRKDDALLLIEVYVDPLSENAQRWSSILKRLAEIDRVHIMVQLVPTFNLKELPLKRFYRYVLQGPCFLCEGAIEFDGIPSDLVVFGLDVWKNWGISPIRAPVDLDNLHLGDSSIDVEFEIDHILVEGHAKESVNNAPPRGAQLTLSNETFSTETIIMANLGYFQFKSQFGQWNLGLKPGRSSEVYDLESSQIEVASWAGHTIYPRLARKPGMETADVLDDKLTASKGSLWSKFKSFTGTDVAAKAHADINIFTVASGHLYERFVYIMVSSVMAHTKHSVKFWFISNFLSPQFRQFIPHLATHLGFEYEMITFTWPHWLRQQTEKQRIIWGYKILFLDVMFPLDLEKVIFVDADQIVRTDMINLINEDLHGKVWGYTPMGDSRKEIEGFRFWKKGYWRDFLNGKPYHISALYVIDLVAFRAQATGDRLRQQYHQLSADPESLSNLDQDLPNHLQAQIPIHSLHADWLWCETWCSDESLKTAKTIDLCQNPMTKEPKLDRARRQLPEWTVYDEQIKSFARTLGHDDLVVDVDKVDQNIEMAKDEL